MPHFPFHAGIWHIVVLCKPCEFIYAVSLLCPEKCLLLKKPHTGVPKHRGTKLVLILKLHPYGLSFIMLESTISATEGEKESSIYPGVKSVRGNENQPGQTGPLV